MRRLDLDQCFGIGSKAEVFAAPVRFPEKRRVILTAAKPRRLPGNTTTVSYRRCAMKNSTFVAELHERLGTPSSETAEGLRLLKARPSSNFHPGNASKSSSWSNVWQSTPRLPPTTPCPDKRCPGFGCWPLPHAPGFQCGISGYRLRNTGAASRVDVSRGKHRKDAAPEVW
jgi:hypothetical protein